MFTARVHYRCISRCTFVSFVKLNSSKKSAIVGHLLWAEVRKFYNGLKEAIQLFVLQIAVALIVQGDVCLCVCVCVSDLQ